jgi:amino acid transporter
VSGFGVSLLPLFFAYAGFESIAQTAGETKDSTHRLPRILLKGITVTALFYIFTSIVSFGVLPGGRLQVSSAPMAEVASMYLPAGAAMFVTIGAIAAIMTALNGTIFVPSRLAIMFVEDGLAPRWLGFVNKATATPIRALTLTLLCCAILLISGQLALALNVAVFALVVLYFIHSLVFLFLPRLNPGLASEIEITLPRRVQQAAAVVSILSMGLMILIQLRLDADVLRSQTLSQRISSQSLTSIELIVVWGVVGAALYQLARMQRSKDLPVTPENPVRQ